MSSLHSLAVDPVMELHARTGDEKHSINSYLRNSSHLSDVAVDNESLDFDSGENTPSSGTVFIEPDAATPREALTGTGSPKLTKVDELYEELVKDYKRSITPLIVEFFSHGDMGELMRSVSELQTDEYGFELVKRLVNMSFDRTDRERQLVSMFLSDAVFRKVLDSGMVEKGFLRLFESIYVDGIEMDVPGAPNMLSKFLARAVVDEIVPPNFLNNEDNIRFGGEVMANAKALLSRDLAPVVLETCWGPGDGRNVNELKKAIVALVQEYLLSYDLDEATRCVRELQSPHFLHELVKKAVTLTIDESIEKQIKMSEFFTHLSINDILSKGQASQGFDRLFSRINDIKLDSPSAPQSLDQFVERAKLTNVINPTYVPKEVPVEHNIYEDDEVV